MKRFLQWAILGLLSLFFLFAGFSKLVDPAAFSHSIAAYRLTGSQLSWVFALWIPWIEVLAALFLWMRRWRLPAVLTLGSLLLFFQIALLSAGIRGLDISCGCLGSSFDSGILLAFIRNCILIGILPFVPGLKGGAS